MNIPRTTQRKLVHVLYAPGTNCEVETMEAVRLAGGDPRLIFLEDIRSGKVKMHKCDNFIDPGGFSFGDYPDTGVAVAVLLEEGYQRLKESHVPFLGICNGMQKAIRAGLLGSGIAMTRNVCRQFVSRPVRHRVIDSHCLWTRGLIGKVLTFPAAHGYGRVVGNGNKIVVMTYEDRSPNGGNIAMLTDEYGTIGVLMDHPERPFDNPDGQLIFKNGLAAA